MITANDVIDVAPEFATMDPARIQRFILRAQPYINSKIWGIKTDYAWALFTAHLLESSENSSSSGGGPVSSEKVGDLQTTYSVPAPQSGTLSATSYGDLFIQLRKSILVSPIVGG